MKFTFSEMNIQLFADDFNVQTTASDGLSVEMKTYYDMTLIDEASANLVHDQFAQKRPIPKNNGKTIEFRKFAPLNKALTPLTEGKPPKGNTLSVSKIEATVSQYGDFITQTDVLELTSLDDTIIQATKLLGKQAGLTLDTITRNVMNAGTNVTFAPTWSGTTPTVVKERTSLDATSRLKVDTVNRVVAQLRAVNAPTINGDYVGIIHPYAAYDLMRDPEWIESHKYAEPNNLYEGEIGKIGGVRFVQTSEAKIFDGEKIALGKDADGNDVYSLKINNAGGYDSAVTSVAVDGATITADALIGLYLKIGDAIVEVTDNDTTSITFASTTINVEDDAEITATECAAGAVFSTLIMGQGAYGTTEVTGGGLETIIKQKGSAGTADPLNQVSSVGWKALKTAEILIPDYLVRIESTSEFSATTDRN